MELNGKKVGFAMTGSFCTFEAALRRLEEIVSLGADVTPILSYAADSTDTRFNTADGLKQALRRVTGNEIIRTIPEAEPIGPKHMLDILLVLPATGNTLAKLALGITDTPVAMAVKSHLRNDGPVVLAISTNDALGNGAKNIGVLLNMRNIFFVPLIQDNPIEKPRSMVFSDGHVVPTLEYALEKRQYQPIIMGYKAFD